MLGNIMSNNYSCFGFHSTIGFFDSPTILRSHLDMLSLSILLFLHLYIIGFIYFNTLECKLIK
ncbi:hypothetical protein Xmir_03038 [Xenorhabdus miraniensis]|uniref:Uncharacterized protein n=1 Tax=Xenorhabdus miraniensis TaxID=351674 RepID=A0A2D0JN01_9GAMM|nr:hypothetical protein Xmir_03038 [Xenorhabdus miraniensis]